MKKQIGAIFLVAGTCIGSGMIALPMVLARVGIVPSIALMLFVGLVMYYAALASLELNLQAGQGLSLGALGRRFSGPIAEIIGTGSFKILSYALLTVYIYGASSMIQHLLAEQISLPMIATGVSLAMGVVLHAPLLFLDTINRVLFIGLLGVVAILIGGLIAMNPWQHVPLLSPHTYEATQWFVVLPVVFTSFGFQVIFHTLTNYCHKNTKMLKRAFLWGSVIPIVVYTVWVFNVLSVIHDRNPGFYHDMMQGHVDVGDLVHHLTAIAQWPAVRMLVWWISLLAIITSMLGVGVGLCDALKGYMPKTHPHIRTPGAAILTIVPSYIVAVWVPDAFIRVLSFAGMILVIIALLMPFYLLKKAKITHYHYPELKSQGLIALSLILGLAVIISEMLQW